MCHFLLIINSTRGRILYRFIRYTAFDRSKVALAYLLPLLCLTPPTDVLPWNNLRKILHGAQRIAKVHSGEEILPKSSTLLSRALERYRQTDNRRICDSKDLNVT